jgi:uncharacterized integral membrane protein
VSREPDERSERDAETERETTERRTPATQQIGRVVVVVATVLFLAFALSNRDSVEVSWVVTVTETPLIVVLLVAFVLGFLVGWGLFWRRQRGRARRASASGE